MLLQFFENTKYIKYITGKILYIKRKVVINFFFNK